MILKMTEWAGMMLFAIAVSRFIMMVTNTDDEMPWRRTEEAENKVMDILKMYQPAED